MSDLVGNPGDRFSQNEAQLIVTKLYVFSSAMPQGTMPLLEIDGKYKVSQSTTIARHLAREFSKYSSLTAFALNSTEHNIYLFFLMPNFKIHEQDISLAFK